jgi:hypothetical protein
MDYHLLLHLSHDEETKRQTGQKTKNIKKQFHEHFCCPVTSSDGAMNFMAWIRKLSNKGQLQSNLGLSDCLVMHHWILVIPMMCRVT